ncbi:unnamed protein product, partial [Mesorhabditis spiculigera]
MTKGKKSKNQKKKFFGHPSNKGKVFKKTYPAPAKTRELRKRGDFTLLPTDGFSVPRCQHGPTLLFGQKKNGQIESRFFTCAVYRNKEKCSFKVGVDQHGNRLPPFADCDITPKAVKNKYNYNCVNKLKSFAKDGKIIWCSECMNIFENRHPHPDCQFLERKMVKYPSKFLDALVDPLAEAQFFFSDESLTILKQLVTGNGADSVLCIGAPRLMEALRAEKSVPNLFMLDIDKRFESFYKSAQFAQYSMLTHHFFDPKSESKFNAFLGKAKKLVVVCDPPFGLFVEPLMASIQKIKTAFEAHGKADRTFDTVLIMPIFVGKRALFLDKELHMHDYKVTYSNHKSFAKPQRSSVRIFTNIPATKIDLKDLDGYKFCDYCEYWVHNDNKHCFMCMKCTSKDGSEYRHCGPCMRCFKAAYRHCKTCERCHIPGRCQKAEGSKKISDEPQAYEAYEDEEEAYGEEEEGEE